MNIAKALKQKNRLARDINTLKSELVNLITINSGVEHDTIEKAEKEHEKRFVEIQDKFREISEMVNKLATLKSDIAIANKDAWENIFTMSEQKGLMGSINFISGSSKKTAIVRRTTGEKTYLANSCTTNQLKEHKQLLQSVIDHTQDLLDDYNAQTTI